MKAPFARDWLTFTLASALCACGGEENEASTSPQRAGNDHSETPIAGGTTGDFTGDAVDCDAVRFEDPGDEPALGFSVAEILAATEGRFDVPVRWTSMCEKPKEASAACDRAAAFIDEWAGRETTVHVEIVSLGEAEVRHPTEEQSVCAQGMFIPVELQLRSDDGLLDQSIKATLWSECGTDSSVSFVQPLEATTGAIAPSNSDLPPSGEIELTLGFFRDRMWFDLYVVPSGATPVLTSDLPPFGENVHDLPRTSVELQEGTPLPSEGSCTVAY